MSDALSKLHKQVSQAQADIQHIAGMLMTPLSEADRSACLKRAERAVGRLRLAPITLSENPATSIVERQKLSVRMGTRRFTRLTNAFSKKWENHWAAVACWFAFYNFCRVHKSIRMTPAMAAGISDHIWSVRELLEAA